MKYSLRTTVAGILALGAMGTAAAQSTDGYHSVQVFPVVVDSTTFVQRFNFTTPNFYPVTLKVKYLPGQGTGQASVGPLACPDVTIPANSSTSVPSLRQLCPGLVSGSAFGFLHVKASASSDGMYNDIPVFAGYSRVSNFAGAGFSVEAFAAHTFTSANSVVTGLRRMAATQSSPAYQTNCFLANMNEVTPSPAPQVKRINYTLYTGQGSYASSVDLLPGQLMRLLDVFSAVGAPAGDFNDASVVFTADGGNAATNRPGLMTFCTVQDNTSFGADFRIAKTAFGRAGIGSDDFSASREILVTTDTVGRRLEIDPGNSLNTHVVYFRHPDTVQCSLLDPVSFAPLTPAAGLEMRVYSTNGVIGGGNNATGTGEMYLGDKADVNRGSSGRYLIEVESNEQNTGVVRPYAMYCSSGSGNTLYELVEYKIPVDTF